MALVFDGPHSADGSHNSELPIGTEWHPLSAIQRSLWFLYKLNPELQGNFNIVFVARARPSIDPEHLQRACNRLASRHPMLRTQFAVICSAPSIAPRATNQGR